MTLKLGDTELIPMKRVNDHACDDNLFKCIALLRWPEIKNKLFYKYGFCVKGHGYEVPLLGKIDWFSKPVPHVEADTFQKKVRLLIQYDVFNFKGDQNYLSETIPRSVMYYLKWLLNFIHPKTISNIITQIENFDFPSLVTSGKSNVEECVKWIVEKVSENSVTDLQRLYLCMVLGHLCTISDVLPCPRDHKTTDMCDRLLQILNISYNPHLLPPSNLKTLEKLATFLVENSSSPGWLTLAAYFHPYLGIGFILGKKNEKFQNNTYETKEYKKMVDMLLLHVEKIESNNQSAYKDLLDLVMKKAPNLNEALKLIEISNVSRLFSNDDEKMNFFVTFYEIQSVSTEKKNFAARLGEFYKIPEKIRGRLHHHLFKTLLECGKSDDELNDNDETIFLQSIISEGDLALDQVFDVLMELSKSTSARRQMLVLKILSNTGFRKSWRDMPFEKKVKVCKSWVITNCINSGVGRGVGGVDKVVAVYGAIDAIIQACSLNVANEALVEEISTEVVRRLLKNEDATFFLKALTKIKGYAFFVLESYKSHVKNILRRKRQKMLKESSTILKEDSSSRYLLTICLCYNKHFRVGM